MDDDEIKDLLSTALSQSGIDDDFPDFSDLFGPSDITPQSGTQNCIEPANFQTPASGNLTGKVIKSEDTKKESQELSFAPYFNSSDSSIITNTNQVIDNKIKLEPVQNVKIEPPGIDIKQEKVLIKQEPIKTENVIKSEFLSIKTDSLGETKTENKTIISESIIKSEELKAQSNDVKLSNTKNTAKTEVKTEEPKEEGGGGFGFGSGDGDGGGWDLFSQAIAQLADTNKKAAEFEAEQKKHQKKDPIPKVAKPAPNPVIPAVKAPATVIPTVIPTIPQTVPVLQQTPQIQSSSGVTQASVIPKIVPIQTVGNTIRRVQTDPQIYTVPRTISGQIPVTVQQVNASQGIRRQGTTTIIQGTQPQIIQKTTSNLTQASLLQRSSSPIIQLAQRSGSPIFIQKSDGQIVSSPGIQLTQSGGIQRSQSPLIMTQDATGKKIIIQSRPAGQGQTVIKTIQQGTGAIKLVKTLPQGVAAQILQAQNKSGGQPLQLVRTSDGSLVKIKAIKPGVTTAGQLGRTVMIKTTQANSGTTILQGQTVISGASLLSQGNRFTMARSASANDLGRKIITTNAGTLRGVSIVNQGTINSIAQSGVQKPNNGVVPTKLTDKDVSRLWANDDISLKKLGVTSQQNKPGSPIIMSNAGGFEVEEEAEEENEELGRAETYAEYMPPKLKIGLRHPDPVVESSSLSSVEPCDVWYRLHIPESCIDNCYLSALQLETITYASQKHEIFLPNKERAGFLIGDGAGVGKGRTIAGIIYENYLQGRKRSLWLSVSNDLRVDAERDLRDIGAGKIDVHPLNKFKYVKISSKINNSVKKGVIFATYSSLIGESHSGGKYRTRLKQITHWCGKDFDGLIIFDECHKAKNLCPTGSSKPTKTGQTVLELQNRLPKARIVYASATGASEPRNMAYMTRLGLWGAGTPFREFNDFIQAVEKRGVGAMELVAMDMKLRGMYIARQLSFQGVTFKVCEIPIPKDFVEVYNSSVRLWVDAREKFQAAADLIDAEHRMRKSMWGQFWSAHQRFFKYLCISAKVRHCVKIARDAVKNGKCVVIGLQSTGEARTLEQLEEAGGELTDFVSTAKGVIQTLVEKHFPAPDKQKTMDLFGGGLFGSFDSSPKQSSLKRKKNFKNSNGAKKQKSDWSDLSSDSSDSDDGFKSDGSKASSESGLSLSESEESDMDEEDDFNPFGNGSDSDDDPWLKKTKKNKKKKAVKKPKKKKEKKKKKKKKENKHKSDDEFGDMDNRLDQALAAAGLKSSKENSVDPYSSIRKSTLPGMDAIDQASSMKKDLMEKIEKLGDCLPPNTLDELIDSLGGPENVAEMTGRKGRVVSTDDGVQYESRSEMDVPLEILNLKEKERFMLGEKCIAIISEAASSGISLQADRRAANQKRRVHITLELPWSADRAIQQFGRTHRSNQVSAPEYVFMISELAGERRFASTVAKRLESLGALTHGDRRATETRDLSRFNIDNKFGRTALEAVMKSVLALESPIVPQPAEYDGNFFEDVKKGLIGVGMVGYDERHGVASLEKDYNNISKFLNRILGMEVQVQNCLFKYFTDTLAAIILQAKRNGKWDLGILDLGSGSELVKKMATRTFKGNFSGTVAKTELHSVKVERGMTWQAAMELWHEHAGPEDGYYLSTQVRNGKRTGILAIAMAGKKKDKLFRVYRPNTGLQARSETLEEIKKKHKKVLPDEALHHWEEQYQGSANQCSHAYWRGNCKRASFGLSCEIGLRTRTYHVLGGSVLSIWGKVESVLASLPGGHATRMQIIRMKTDDGLRIVGSLIPPQALDPLINMLKQSTSTSNPPQTPQPQPSIGGYRGPAGGSSSGGLGTSYINNSQTSYIQNSVTPQTIVRPSSSNSAFLSMPTF